jgi:hypothetical protein
MHVDLRKPEGCLQSTRRFAGLFEVSFDTRQWLVSVSRKCASDGLRQALKRFESFGKHL